MPLFWDSSFLARERLGLVAVKSLGAGGAAAGVARDRDEAGGCGIAFELSTEAVVAAGAADGCVESGVVATEGAG